MTSQYGPTNKKGRPGTGEVFDQLAFEKAPENTGVAGARSKYGPNQKPGKPEQWIEMEGGVSIYGGE